jgi:hypothetical protein
MNNWLVVTNEPSSPAQTLGSWVLIQLEAWMSVFMLFCV